MCKAILPIVLVSLVSLAGFAAPQMPTDFKTVREASVGLADFSKSLRENRDRRGLFASIYALTVAQTERSLNSGAFEDPAWVRTLVVNYANLYRRTIMNELNGRRSRLSLGWQFEFAYTESKNWNADLDLVYGINVHIARDLVEALYITRTNFKSESKHRDFLLISESLNQAMPAIWNVFESYGPESSVPSVIQRSVAMEWITYARSMAWDRAFNTYEYSAVKKKDFLDRVDGWLVREQKRYGTRYPLVRY